MATAEPMRRAGRTFVGFGFGAIQAGLFLYEAQRSGNFRRLVVAEVLPDVVAAVRQAGGRYCLNIAHADRVEAASVGPVEIGIPEQESFRRVLVDAVAEAEEIATAVPSVRAYVSGSGASIHRILAGGLRKKAAADGPRAVVYAAENHNHAAEILEQAVLDEIPPEERQGVRSRVRFLNTVIGKMSGLVTDPAEIEARQLSAITDECRRAFLVEAFSRILISRIRFEEGGPFSRGIDSFEEKDDLLPFEEAKLFGHNATHALAAYLGAFRGVEYIAGLRDLPELLDSIRAAFLRESGEALIRRHKGVDRLFTSEGYREYADDLLERMLNPHLQDTVERVGRDAQRKLGWDDRLVGTMRMALGEGIPPRRYAVGAAAALAHLDPGILTGGVGASALLDRLWETQAPDPGERRAVLKLIEEGSVLLSRWREAGYPHLESCFSEG